jgi:hypothetical protein
MNYAVTKDIPAGISSGQEFGDDLETASEAFGEAAFRTSAPVGTVITLWNGQRRLDRATVTESSKAAYRAEISADLDRIVDQANRNAAARIEGS